MRSSQMMNSGWVFDNSYTRLPELMFSRLDPIKVPAPETVILNHSLAEVLGLSDLNNNSADLFSGNTIPEGAEPLAQAYAGHQFGHFTMLGDGRAIVLGEHITPDKKRFDIQFKGSGRTPFSRGGDGRAALGPMLREYIISEAMFGLGIPTTRSLAVVKTGEDVFRENGPLPGAVLTRVAASHIRVGTFEYLAMRGDVEATKRLVEYALNRHYPEIRAEETPALTLLNGVMAKQLELVLNWLRVGFIHGVMNTDNMTISGETIDYGPCAFMDIYNPNTVFSSIDHAGRYAFSNQPHIVKWNLSRFAETLLPLLNPDKNIAVEIATTTIESFDEKFAAGMLSMMKKKLGLFGDDADDENLIDDLLALMDKNGADYTNTFLSINHDDIQQNYLKDWQQRWHSRLQNQSQPFNLSQQMMQDNNPAVIPRNHKVEEALASASEDGDLKPFKDLLKAVKTPYKNRPELAPYQLLPVTGSEEYQTFCGT
ncbi:MAG: YdiU family protein [Magnetococcales bacterium]|nr:YdiU family protein [Magnetococcales bacterium]